MEPSILPRPVLVIGLVNWPVRAVAGLKPISLRVRRRPLWLDSQRQHPQLRPRYLQVQQPPLRAQVGCLKYGRRPPGLEMLQRRGGPSRRNDWQHQRNRDWRIGSPRYRFECRRRVVLSQTDNINMQVRWNCLWTPYFITIIISTPNFPFSSMLMRLQDTPLNDL